MFAHSMHALLGKTLYISEQNEKIKEKDKLIKNNEDNNNYKNNDNNETNNNKTCCVIL